VIQLVNSLHEGRRQVLLSESLFAETFGRERQKHKAVLLSPALLVIDLQNFYTQRESRAYLKGIEGVVANSLGLVEGFMSYGLPVASTVHRGGAKMMVQWWGNAVEEGWAVPQFRDLPIFYKDTYDAFHDTGLDAFLKSNNVNQLVICGARTHLCCETTARSAFTNGYATMMVEDALCDKTFDHHICSLKNLANGFSVISRTAEVLKLLEGDFS